MEVLSLEANLPVGSDTASRMETNDSADPQVMSIKSVYSMIASLRDELRSGRSTEHKLLREGIMEDLKLFKEACVQDTAQEVQKVINRQNVKIKSVHDEVSFWRLKSETLTDVCNKMATEIGDLTARIENLEVNNSKKMVIVTGLQLPKVEYKSEGIEYLISFLHTELEIDVEVDDYYTLGAIDPKPIVIIFQNIQQKRLCMRNKNKLQGVKTDKGRKVFINDYLPPSNLEKRKREQDIAHCYEGQPNAVTYQKGGMCINGIPYRKKVEPPTPKQLVDISPQQLEEILEMKLIKGVPERMDNSVFHAYSADVNTHEQVNKLYLKLKLAHPDARHIVCAFSIDFPEKCYADDFHDDGEPAAGRLLLDLLTSNGIKNKVVFVARNYGGIKMGVDRFLCYTKAARDALNLNINFTEDNPGASSRQQQLTNIRRQYGTSYRGRQYGRARGSNFNQSARGATYRPAVRPPTPYRSYQPMRMNAPAPRFPRGAPAIRSTYRPWGTQGHVKPTYQKMWRDQDSGAANQMNYSENNDANEDWAGDNPGSFATQEKQVV